MSYNNIPHEMREYKQWVLWRYELEEQDKEPTKVPYSATKRNQFGPVHASVTDADTWSSYDECVSILNANHNTFSGLGFVLTENDPFCFIDLDDTKGDSANFERQQKVYAEFNTYAELSPSGKGLHLIGYGNVPSGRKRSKIEIYSQVRFMTMTGNVYNKVAIRDVSELAQVLWSQMGKDKGTSFYDPQSPQTMEDAAVMDTAANAENSVKFLDLYNGNWQSYYTSQSEADVALINIIAFYTQNRQQIIRMFHASALGKRDKAKRKDYLERTINIAFDRLLPPVDIEGMADAINLAVAQKKSAAKAAEASATLSRSGDEGQPIQTAHNSSSEPEPFSQEYYEGVQGVPLHLKVPPPGLMGEICDFIYKQAPRQVPEVALTAAIGLMAGICGRAYNVSGTGLNQYVLFLGETGVGKEAISSGIDKILTELRLMIPIVDQYLGPSSIASGQALIKGLEDAPCFVSIVGEFDSMMREMTAPNANSASIALMRVILDLYNKSGHNRQARKMIYSDAAKNTKNVMSPSVSLLGEATPERLFGTLNEELISSGLLPRFTIVEYKGRRMPLNEGHKTVKPSQDLINKMAVLVEQCAKLDQNNHVIDVEYSDDAKAILDAFDKECDSRINASHKDVVRHLWNRAHLKVLKLAATIAIGLNPWAPRIDMICANYAKSMIVYDISNILARFHEGSIGVQSGDVEQYNTLKRICIEFISRTYEENIRYGVTRPYHDAKVIPYAYINKRMSCIACFRKDKAGSTAAIKRTIRQFIDEGVLVEMNKQQATMQFGSGQLAYAISNVRHMMTGG